MITNQQAEELYKFIRHYFKTYKIPTDEDLIQEVMAYLVGIYDKWDESKGKFSTFIYTCIKHRLRIIYSHNNRKKRKKPKDTIELDYVSNNPYSKTYCENLYSLFPQFDDYDEDKKNFVEEILPLMNKETIEFFLNEKSHKEIAEETKATSSNVGQKIRHNIKKIREYCLKKGYEIGDFF